MPIREITLDLVRASMETLARNLNCQITELEVRDVREEMGSGSNGTVGAYVKIVKNEILAAKEFDRTIWSPKIKSALTEEINRLVENTKEVQYEKIKVIEKLNAELLDSNETAENKIQQLNDELSSRVNNYNNAIDKLKQELVRAQQQLSSAKERELEISEELQEAQNKLGLAQQELAIAKSDLSNLKTDFTAKQQEIKDIEKTLRETNSVREQAERRADLAAQDANHRQDTIALLKRNIIEQEKEIKELKGKYNESSTEVQTLHEKLEKALHERVIELRGNTAQPEIQTENAGKKSKPA